jgi:arylsulfatase
LKCSRDPQAQCPGTSDSISEELGMTMDCAHKGRRRLTRLAALAMLLGGTTMLSGAHALEILPKPLPPFAGKIDRDRMQAVPAAPQLVKAKKGSPNIVLILLDDNGFGQNSTFGGPAETPELTKLAADGLKYNGFHTPSLCSPTRAALLSGRDAHRIGWGPVPEDARGYPGYNTIWPRSAASGAEVLRLNGYSTAAFGKWHNTPFTETSAAGPFDRWPTSLGFEYFYGFNSGYDSQYEPRLFRNTIAVEPNKTPEQGYHLTADLVDDAVRWVHQHDAVYPDKPFFLYLATGALHWPHHAPKDVIAKYKGKFDQGWDKLREETFVRQKKLGVIPANAELTPRDPRLPAWDSLSAEQKKLHARQMEVYSAFVEHTDREVGRLISTLRADGHVEDTLVIYIAGDNGASGEGGLPGREHFAIKGGNAPLPERVAELDNFGSVKFDNHYAAAWAWAASTPFKGMKQMAHYLGGTRNELVVSWPGHIKDTGALRSQFQFATDIVPTLFEVAGITAPDVVHGEPQMSLDGKSFAASFTNANAPGSHSVQAWETRGNRAIFKDGWIAGAGHLPPWNRAGWNKTPVAENWELYNLNEDFSEAHDLAAKNPDKLKEMVALFDQEAKRTNLYPLSPLLEPLPAPADGKRKHYVFKSGVSDLPWMNGPWVVGQTHAITADIDIPAGGGDGVLIADGGRYGGFTFYVKDGKPTYEANAFGREAAKVVADRTLAPGRHTVGMTYTLDSDTTDWTTVGQPHTAGGSGPFPGTIRLVIDGQPAGEGKVENISMHYDGVLTIGKDPVSPVSRNYPAPFAFTGKIEKVEVKIK